MEFISVGYYDVGRRIVRQSNDCVCVSIGG